MSTRMTAEERREAVLAAASAAFAEGGYQGTSTEDVARRAGISQPYIFRLFGSKKDLFLAVVDQCFARTCARFERAAKGVPADEALMAMGSAYGELISNPVNLQLMMHSFAASVTDPDVRRVAQKGMHKIWRAGAEASGAGPSELRRWLATGMLCNMVAALGLDRLEESWAQEVRDLDDKCLDVPDYALRVHAASGGRFDH
jgi:AcrR family transcriptional regulator